MVNHRRSSISSLESSQHESSKQSDSKSTPDENTGAKKVEERKEPKAVRKRNSNKNDTKPTTSEEVSDKLTEPEERNKSVLNSSLDNGNSDVSSVCQNETSQVNNVSDMSTSVRNRPFSSDKSKGRLICSLSLDRLTGILETLTQSKISTSTVSISNDCHPTSAESQNNMKIICLYCDRTFSSHKLYAKHSERAHRLVEGRRTSVRVNPAPTNDDSNDGTQTFLGCSFCASNKLSSMVVEDLDQLFMHLINAHSDKYFACKECVIRFTNEECHQTHMKLVHNIDLLTTTESTSIPLTKPLSIVVDYQEEVMARAAAVKNIKKDNEGRLTRNSAKTIYAERSNEMLSAKEQMLLRLGIAHHRSPRTRKGAKNRRGANTESQPRSKSGRSSAVNLNSEGSEFVIVKSKNEILNCTFDEDFYEAVNNNVRMNLSCHLDGKINGNPTEPSPLSPVTVCPTVRSTVVHSPLETESEIHEATALSTTTAFPTLLTADQYGAATVTTNKNRKPVTKNSWKWKWDCVKKYKYVNEGGKIVKKIKQPFSGQRDLSKLDMWTQLVMRKKHEDLKDIEASSDKTNKKPKISGSDRNQAMSNAALSISCARQEKRRIVEQLNQILDARLLPQINVEQDEQRTIKPEPDDDNRLEAPQFDARTKEFAESELPQVLQLEPATQVNHEKVLLSGEWARPRCYICYCCGTKFDSYKHLDDHKYGRHPNVSCTHYEIVGRELIEKQFYSHFYLPGKALETNRLLHTAHANLTSNDTFESSGEKLKEKEAIPVEDSMDSVTSATGSSLTSHTVETDTNTKTSKSSNISSSSSQLTPHSPIKSKCTKCEKETNSMLELHRHMLDCSGDYAWLQVKKRLKYRRLLGKKRRISRNAATIRRPKSNSKTEDDEKDGSSPKPKPPSTPKVRPSDGK